MAAYARTARDRVDKADQRRTLCNLRAALEAALGLRFDSEEGEGFFRSALVQTLFYGVFAAWVVWSRSGAARTGQRFSWRTAQWTLNVPMVRVLFEQLTTPSNLPVGLDEVLDWTEDMLARVDRDLFFDRLEHEDAVQYFYEPFLQAYDPELRKQLGVWYTPPAVVRYMVARVHESLQRDLGLPLGLADDQVQVLDPCTGTGSFLVEVLRTIARVLDEHHGDALVGQQAKRAALRRVHGFELPPAPFVIAHLQLGLLLEELGAPLDRASGERASVFLTNALTGWTNEDQQVLPFDEFESERAAADTVKKFEPILVVLGNPPYNGYAGVSRDEESGLLHPYKDGLSKPPWEITKNKLDDLYIRFFRVAERRVAERTRRGIICFTSNSGWLGDPSAVVMRKRLTSEFDRVYIDNLNGDSRETGKRTPDGLSDPSIFSTTSNRAGIQVGTAITLMVRTEPRDTDNVKAFYRDFWGRRKSSDLEESLARPQAEPSYERLTPDRTNWFRLRRWKPRPGYETWPLITDLALERPELGLNENRDEGLVSVDRDNLVERIGHFLDPSVGFSELDKETVRQLVAPWARYDAKDVRAKLLADSPFDTAKIQRFQVKPFDVRYAYIDATTKLWNEPRSRYVKSAALGSEFLLARRRAPRAHDGAAFLLSPHLIDQHVLHKDAYTIPLVIPSATDDDGPMRLFPVTDSHDSGMSWRPNLSPLAVELLADLGYRDADTSRDTARMLWLHVLAIGYSSLYLEENADALLSGWARVPVPKSAFALEDSAQLGRLIGALLDVDTPLPGVDTLARDRLTTIGRVGRVDDQPLQPRDLRVDAGWGVQQVRVLKSGATSHAVMPGDGRLVERDRTSDEAASLSATERALFGERVLDIYLNEDACWSGVPQAVWDYKIGGFQVLRKWLSYRETSILGRPLTAEDVRQFTSICRRLAELVLLAPDLDHNYRATTGAVAQEPLPVLIQSSA